MVSVKINEQGCTLGLVPAQLPLLAYLSKTQVRSSHGRGKSIPLTSLIKALPLTGQADFRVLDGS
jgi:hypothetical protein